MKNYIFVLLLLSTFSSCQKDEIKEVSFYDCTLSFPDNSASHPKADAFAAAFDTEFGKVPGAQVAVRSKDGNSWTSALGHADIPSDITFKTCTKTMIGSVSKVVTAAMILQLQDESILDIDDPLSNWIDNSILSKLANAEQATLRQLLKHSSGIPEYLGVRSHIDAVNKPFNKETQEEKLKYAYGKSATNELGAVYNYSNTNYVLLGLVIEKARAMPLWDVVQQYISVPLGLESFECGTHETPIPDGTARPYLAVNDKYNDFMHMAVYDGATGDGGIATNMQDLNAFFDALFNGAIISEAALKDMTNDKIDQNGSASYGGEGFGPEFYGLGLEVYDSPFGICYGHTGSTTAYEAYSIYFAESGVSVSLAFSGASELNDYDGHRSELVWSLVDLALD